MYLKRLTAQVTAIAIGCASTAIYADANYTQRAKEQAERAAAAAAIAADQVEAARVAEPETSTQGAETNVAPAGNAAQTSTSTRSSSSETAQADGVKTDAKASNRGGNGPMEDQPLVIDVSNLYDEDGLGDLTMQWQVQLASGGWQTIDGAVSQSFTPRQNHVGSSLRVVIQYVDGEGTLEVIETAPTGAVQNANDLPQGLRSSVVPLSKTTPLRLMSRASPTRTALANSPINGNAHPMRHAGLRIKQIPSTQHCFA